MALGSKFLTSMLAAFVCITSQAQLNDDSTIIKKISEEVLQNGKAYSNLRELCKSIGSRLSGSAGMYKAEDWGIKILQQSGADAAYKQQCMVPHWVRGGKAEARFKTRKRSMDPDFTVASLGNAVGTPQEGITAPIIEVKNYEDLNRRKDEVKGKIVFYNYPYNKKLLGGAYGDAVKYRGGGASAAAKYGAVAVLVRSVTAANDDHPHTGALRYNDSFPKIPALAISTKDAEDLSYFLGRNYKNENFFIKSNAKMLPDTIAHNIIGEIKGSEFPNEIITIGGHLDSWDLGEGAHDDGAGMVQSIEVLRVLKAIGYTPKRTIRIVLFANEENGLRGGTKYMEEAKAKGEKHIMAMESDGGGETPKGFVCGMTAEQYAKVAEWKKYFTQFDADKFVFSKGGSGGADIGPLQTAFKTAQFGLNTAGNRYFDYHHAATDVFENVHERELHMGAVTMAAIVYLVDKYGL
jgi:carboxypeptidase Q